MRFLLAEVIISLHKLVNSVLASEQIIYIPFHFFMINKCLALSDSSLIHYQHRNDVDNLFLRVCAVLLIKNWRKITTHRTLACAPVKSWHGNSLNDFHSKSSYRYHIQFGWKSIAKCFLTIIFSLTKTLFPIIFNWKRVAIPTFLKKSST